MDSVGEAKVQQAASSETVQSEHCVGHLGHKYAYSGEVSQEIVKKFLETYTAGQHAEVRITFEELKERTAIGKVDFGDYIIEISRELDQDEKHDGPLNSIMRHLSTLEGVGPKTLLITKVPDKTEVPVKPESSSKPKEPIDLSPALLGPPKREEKKLSFLSCFNLRSITRYLIHQELSGIDLGRFLKDNQFNALKNFLCRHPLVFLKSSVRDSLTGILKHADIGISAEDSRKYKEHYALLKKELPGLFAKGGPLAFLEENGGNRIVENRRKPLEALYKEYPGLRGDSKTDLFLRDKQCYKAFNAFCLAKDNYIKSGYTHTAWQKLQSAKNALNSYFINNKNSDSLQMALNELMQDLDLHHENTEGLKAILLKEFDLALENADTLPKDTLVSLIQYLEALKTGKYNFTEMGQITEKLQKAGIFTEEVMGCIEPLVKDAAEEINKLDTEKIFSEEDKQQLTLFFALQPDLLPVLQEMLKNSKGFGLRARATVNNAVLQIEEKNGGYLFEAKGPLAQFNRSAYSTMGNNLLSVWDGKPEQLSGIRNLQQFLLQNPKAQKAFNGYMHTVDTVFRRYSPYDLENVESQFSLLRKAGGDLPEVLENYHSKVLAKLEETAKNKEAAASTAMDASTILPKAATPAYKNTMSVFNSGAYNEAFKDKPELAEHFIAYQRSAMEDNYKQMALHLLAMKIIINTHFLGNKTLLRFVNQGLEVLKKPLEQVSVEALSKLEQPLFAQVFAPFTKEVVRELVKKDHGFAVLLDDFLEQVNLANQKMLASYTKSGTADTWPSEAYFASEAMVKQYFEFGKDNGLNHLGDLKVAMKLTQNLKELHYQGNFQAITDSMQTALFNGMPLTDQSYEELCARTKSETSASPSSGTISRYFSNMRDAKDGYIEAGSGGFSYRTAWVENSNDAKTAEKLRPFRSGQRIVEMKKQEKKVSFAIDLDLKFLGDLTLGQSHLAIEYIENYMVDMINNTKGSRGFRAYANACKVFTDQQMADLTFAAQRFYQQTIDKYNAALFALNHPDAKIPEFPLKVEPPEQQAA